MKLSLFTLVPYKPGDPFLLLTQRLNKPTFCPVLCLHADLPSKRLYNPPHLDPPMSPHVYRKLFTVANAEQLPAATRAEKPVHFQKPNRKMRKECKSSCKLYDTEKKLSKHSHTDGTVRIHT